MSLKKKFKWWVIIQNDSWLNNAHGAFSLGFITRNKVVSRDNKGHLHCTFS